MLEFIDLFAGLGGFRIAFEKSGCRCVFSSEIDKYVREVYRDNFGEYPAGDITEISTNEIPDHDILCAGFPCQPFSIAGKRKGFEDSRGTLFFDIARILKDKQPKAFLLENVRGIVSHDAGSTIKTIENILDSLGYNFRYKIMNSIDYGIPQNRERWYCVGFRKDLNIKFEDDDKKDELVFYFPPKQSLKLNIEDFIDKDVKGYDATEKAMENIYVHLDKFIQKKGINKEKLIIANEIRPSRCHFRNDGIVPCFTAKMGTGGNNVPVIVDYSRKLTENECLRIMGFPPNYRIKPNNQQSYKQIGNSVIVTLIELFAKEIKRILNKEI